MSVYKRKGSPYFYYNFVCKGRRFAGSTKATARRDAERVERELRERARSDTKEIRKSAYTISEACGIYWEEKGHRARGNWQADTARYLQQICQIIGEDLPINELGDKDVNRFVQARLNTFEDGRGHATINRALAVFRSVYNHAKDLHEQQVKKIHWPKHFFSESNLRVRWLTREEMTRLLTLLPLHTQQAAAWSVYTGMRLSATYDLLWSDIDMAKREAKIIKKGGEQQTIFLSQDAMELLAVIPRDSGIYVFNRRNRRKIWEAALAAAEIKDFRWHDLRHTHATWLRQAGAALEIVQRSLGHKSVTTTQRYAHVDDGEVRQALLNLPNLNFPFQETDYQNVVRFKRAPDSIYFIQAADAIKIGMSSAPNERLANMQVGSHVQLRMLGWMDGGRMVEKLIHKIFMAHHIHGEWFRMHEEIARFIDEKCVRPEESHTTRRVTDANDSGTET